MFFVPVAAPAYYPRHARRGPVFSSLELLDDGLLVTVDTTFRQSSPTASSPSFKLSSLLSNVTRHRCEPACHVQEIEEHVRWVQHQLALLARRKQLIRARREKIEEDQRLRQHAEAERVLELAKHVRTEAEKPQVRVRFAPCHVGPTRPNALPASTIVTPKPVLKPSPPAIST
ncbi:hypothetical protein EXIGLDRAFT_776409 [Exidia glandulosa HHB12029]|uniref:Uncharacterized protein n=1 Tax=Exidia glandulosa HHB12029 TaxID=1314781 RepID=A0A165ZP15_EXIGL|nr:hypothetical protein EXIGLDRAFT_776409 [Exidia glandulosa HHB12029]